MIELRGNLFEKRKGMTTIELQLDEHTLELARRAAEARHLTLEALMQEIVRLLANSETEDPIVGMFAEEPELLDQVLESATSARERDPLRLPDEQVAA